MYEALAPRVRRSGRRRPGRRPAPGGGTGRAAARPRPAGCGGDRRAVPRAGGVAGGAPGPGARAEPRRARGRRPRPVPVRGDADPLAVGRADRRYHGGGRGRDDPAAPRPDAAGPVAAAAAAGAGRRAARYGRLGLGRQRPQAVGRHPGHRPVDGLRRHRHGHPAGDRVRPGQRGLPAADHRPGRLPDRAHLHGRGQLDEDRAGTGDRPGHRPAVPGRRAHAVPLGVPGRLLRPGRYLMTAPAVLRRHADLLSNSGSLMASSLVTSSLGFVFWWVAARVAPVETVGAAWAAVSALTLIGTAGMFGLGTLLIAELPRMGTGRGRLISACLLAAGTVSAAGGLLYVLVGPAVSSGLRHSVG